MAQPCEQEPQIKEIKGSMAALVAEFRGVATDIRDILLEDREHAIKIQQVEKNVDVLFTSQRTMKTDISGLRDWRNRLDGALKVFLAIPVACSLISVLVTCYLAFFKG